MLFGMQPPVRPDARQLNDAAARLQTRFEQDPSIPSMQPGGFTSLGVPGLPPLGPAPISLLQDSAAGTSPQGMPTQQQPSQPATPFQWGADGSRMTPDEIASQDKIDQQRIAAGMDYSPVQSWTQGASRVAQALVASMDQKKLGKASAQNYAETRAAAASLGSGANGQSIASILASPYIDDDVKKAATQAGQQQSELQRQIAVARWKHDNPDAPTPDSVGQHVTTLNAIQPGLGDRYAQNFANNGGSQVPQMMSIPGAGTFMVPRSGDATAPQPPATTSPPDEAVSMLRKDPHLAPQFDETFGAGASARYLSGGAASAAPVPFPR